MLWSEGFCTERMKTGPISLCLHSQLIRHTLNRLDPFRWQIRLCNMTLRRIWSCFGGSGEVKVSLCLFLSADPHANASRKKINQPINSHISLSMEAIRETQYCESFPFCRRQKSETLTIISLYMIVMVKCRSDKQFVLRFESSIIS